MSGRKQQFAAKVVVSGVPKALSYSLEGDAAIAEVGSEVTIELGRRQARGWLVDKIPLEQALLELQPERAAEAQGAAAAQLGFFAEEKNPFQSRLKPIRAWNPAFLPEQLRLFEWMAEYYGTSLVDIIENAVPLRSTARKVRCAAPTDELRRAVEEDPTLLEVLARRAPAQAKILERLLAEESPVPTALLAEATASARSALQALEKKKLIELSKAHPSSLPAVAPLPDKDAVRLFSNDAPESLTTAQQSALEQIRESLARQTFESLLLFGVTGSGKTEVYLRAIAQVLEEGGSALVIIPEIALTPQFVDQFRARLNAPVALLHSQVGTTARWEAWDSLLAGTRRVAIGARSAVFAPLPQLRLIIVDEEHESSYKQSEGLRYHARDVAVMRAKFAGCTVVLGSATPSFESLVNVRRGRYRVLELPERVSTRPLPALEIVDMTKIKKSEMPSPTLSPQLHVAIQETLARKGQVVILYNRRGFASYLQCETCSEAIQCPNCSVALTYHRNKHQLLCHYCNLSMLPPAHCRFCRDPQTTRIEEPDPEAPVNPKATEKIGMLAHRGSGTEKVVDELATLFPQAKIVRMDRDTVGRKDAYREILGSMRSGAADILVGTQMIAKGHDLPGVTLVGIVDADLGLHLPDFRSSEKIFQLITQAAGRAGRGSEPGRVLVQTREPNHPTIVATVTGRFKAFARYELEFRKKLGYPPVGRMLRVIISSPDRQEAFEAAREVRQVLASFLAPKSTDDPSQSRPAVLGPAPAPYERLRGRYRWHIIVKSRSAKIISETARHLGLWRISAEGYKDLRLSVDVDPMDML